MKIFNQLKAGRYIQKLKTSRNLTPEALDQARNELVAMGPAAIKPLMESLSHGEARGPAMDVLAKLLDDKTLDRYIEALSSPNPAIATGVTSVLAKSRGYDVSRLVELLSDPSLSKSNLEKILWEQKEHLPAYRLIGLVPALGKDAKAVIFRLLEHAPNKSIIPDLIPLADNEDWWLRLHVARLLGEFSDSACVSALTKLLEDQHKSVRLEAVTSIHRIKGQEAIPGLTNRLRDGDLKVQTAAIDALIDICDAKSVPQLLEVLKDESEYARRAAVEVLNAVATTEAIQDLVRAIRDEDWWVRVRAADALGTLGGPKVVNGVVGLLNDPDDFIRRYAVEILNAVPSEEAVEHLIKALRDNDWWVRERSIDALAKTGDERAIDPLLDLMHQDDDAAPHCVRALGILGHTRVLQKLVDLAASENDEIQREAVDALVVFSKKDLSSEDKALVSSTLSDLRDNSGRQTPDPLKGHEMEVFGPEAGRSEADRNRPGEAVPSQPSLQAEPVPAEPSIASGSLKADQAPSIQDHVNYYKLSKNTILLNRYKVLRQIGKGGFGSIYLVEDSAIQDELILKILNPQLSMDDTAIRRFVQELKLTRSITHENVIRLYDFLDLGGARAVSMEYFASKDLGRIIHKEGNLEIRRTLFIISQVCKGLMAAHEAGIIHRDIKPANILVGEGDTVKIVDFGLASMEQRVGSRLTKSGLLIGTPEYMAPEQISGTEVDHRSDIYSLGLVMYEMLSGRKPFTAETPVKVLFLHLEGEAEPLSNLVEGMPRGLEELIVSTMAKDPSDRPQDSMAFHKAIEETLSDLAEAA
jgi:serine/threonine-protein kinase